MDELDLRLRELAQRETLPLPEEYEAMMDRLCGEFQQGAVENSRRRHRPGKRMLVLAAAVAALLSISAAANGWFSHILTYFQEESGGLTQEQETAIQEGTAALGRSVTDHGVTVTVEEAYGDGVDFYVFLTVSADTLPDEVTGFEEFWLRVRESGQGEGVCSVERLPNPSADHATFLLKKHGNYMAEGELLKPGKAMTCELRLQNLISCPNTEQDYEIVAEGDWSMEFELDYDGTERTMYPNGLTLEGSTSIFETNLHTATVESISLRPLGGELHYWTGPDVYTLELPRPTVLLADGSEIALRWKMGGMEFDADTPYQGRNYYSYQAESPILLDQVTAIRFEDVEVPWMPET